ncbi:MAG TPA: NHLP bacteriocin export ABC transporter permease/ATPase subunit [Thermoanaerobaculia bacterium]|nr:NHLP bacteriocin export ABC transporter permease/ATPase subunit [Thermoanaerobaculia bacterium]
MSDPARSQPPPAPRPPWSRLLAGEGTLVEVGGNTPFLLDDADSVWVVEAGDVNVFAVQLDERHEPGARSHYVNIGAGELLFGMDLERYGIGSAFLAVGAVGTRLRRLPMLRLRQRLAADEEIAVAAARAVDRWVAALSEALTREIIPGPVVDLSLVPDELCALAPQQVARSNRGVLWLEARGGQLLFIGMEALDFSAEESADETLGAFLPVTPSTWVEALVEDGSEVLLEGRVAADAIRMPALWAGLAAFHEVLCQCEFINKKLATVDEFNRLKSRAENAATARAQALVELASVLQREEQQPIEVAADEDPVLAACRVVGRGLGITIRRHPEMKPDLPGADKVQMIAKASRFRTRRVALRDDWWRRDQGPILAELESTGDYVALLPVGPRSYVLLDPATGVRQRVNARVAAQVGVFGTAFYRPFPDGPLSPRRLVHFGMRGLRGDSLTLLGVGAMIGVLGTVTPWITGRIFDTAVPEADRSVLLQFAAALLGAALVRSALIIAQNVASLRIQSRLDYTLGAALWDRLLDLPSRFFRDYTAGDLAQRAQGISAIRDLLAGAGIASVLGFVSSIFYVALMVYYDARLGLVAIGLTVVFVAVTVGANALQLRYQRQAVNRQGRLQGLVLQLLSGIAKLRIAGAESHAFRVWAGQFSDLRRVSTEVGTIQNRVEVFNAGFGVISSLVVFLAVSSFRRDTGGLTTGEFIAFNAAFGSFLAAAQSLSQASLSMLRAIPIYERLEPIVTTPPEIDENKAYPGKLTGRIEVSHVHFRYAGDGPWILRDVTMTIEPGEFVAVVGGSGSGKSTLMRVMLGFERPEKGSVYYDGQELDALDVREVRQQLGVVLQDSRLLPTEIYRNIIGNSSSLTIDDAWEAARQAGMEEDIKEMPMGMHTYVSEGGGGFSGGQKQRLLIARALVRKPRIVFMDEATSALDNRTQKIVTESLDRMQATRVVIAHRLSTVINADRIYVLQDGQIVERGDYQSLMRQDGVFAQLARRQQA